MNEEEFVAHYREYLPYISRFLARRVEIRDVEDLAADVFEIAWHKRDRAKPGFELAWLYKIAGYVVANHRRKELSKAKTLLNLRFVDFAASAELIAVNDIDLSRAMSQLSPKDQALLSLTALDGLPVKEAAALLSLSPNAASIRLSRIRAQLASLLTISES